MKLRPAVIEGLLHVGAFALGTAAVFAGAGWIDRGAETLCVRFRVPDAVRGALLLAVSSSFPELVTAVGASLWHEDPELGFSSVAGSAVFNVTMIPAAAAAFARRLDVAPKQLRREGAFYLASVLALGGGVAWAWLASARSSRPTLQAYMLLPAALVYAAYAWDKLRAGRVSEEALEETDAGPTGRAAGQVALGMLFVTGGVEGLLRFAEWLGRVLETPSFLWGATVVAAATSLPDLALSVRAARKGQSEVAITNAFGSNVFDLAVVVTLTALLGGGLVLHAPVAGALVVALGVVTVLAVAVASHRERVTRPGAALLIALYAAFVGVTVILSRLAPG